MLPMESRLNSSGTCSQDSQRCSSEIRIIVLLSALGQTPETFTGRIVFMSMFNDISCDRKKQQRWMFGKCHSRESTCKEMWYWAMVICWTRFWKEMVFFREWSTRSLGPHCGRDVTTIRRKRTSYLPCNDSAVQRHSQEQRTWKTVYTLRCRCGHSWYNLSQYSFCQPDQYQRSSGSRTRRIWEPSR